MATKNVSVRIPAMLHQRIQTAAEEDRRSLNSQILWLIETGLTNRKDLR